MKILEFSPDASAEKKEVIPFEEFYEKNWPSVLFYLMKKTENREDAEDIASEAFIYCYDHYSSYDPQKSSQTTWLYLIVNSRLKNYYRNRKQNTDISELEDFLFSDEPDMEHAVYLEQLRIGLAEAIKQLPQKQQEIVIRRYFLNESSEELADRFETTPGNIRVLLSRALDKLEKECKNFE